MCEYDFISEYVSCSYRAFRLADHGLTPLKGLLRTCPDVVNASQPEAANRGALVCRDEMSVHSDLTNIETYA